MNRTERLLETLRQVMRSRGLKYQDLADKLSLSLPTVKRFFNQGSDVSLDRLESMCVAAGIDFYDLVDLSRTDPGGVSMTAEQEELLTDPVALAAFFAATLNLNRLHIKAFKSMSEAAIDSALKLLEQHGMVERHSHGRLKSRFTFFSLRWIPGGPFEKRYTKEFRDGFSREAFGTGGGFSDFRQIYLTRASLTALSVKMQELLNEAIAMSKADVKNDMFEMLAVGVLMGAEPWMPEVIRQLYQPDAACASALRKQREQLEPSDD